MSSMRNAVQRRNHKERAQPLERQKWGILEKHKDYSLRAKDHNQKKRKLNVLKAKAADRNEDEFYFGMMSSKSRNGIKIAQRGTENSGGGGKSLSMDVVKLMKTQDVAYLRTTLQSTKKEMDGLEKEIVAAEVGVKVDSPMLAKGKVIFRDDEADVLSHPNQPEEDLDDMYEGESEAEDTAAPAVPLNKSEKVAAKRKRHSLEVKRGRLEVLRDRTKTLTTALREVEDQRIRMSGKGGGITKKGVVFKSRERTR